MRKTALLLALGLAVALAAPASVWAHEQVLLAQDLENETEDQADPEEAGETGQELGGEGEGQSDPEAETGADEGESGGTEQTGPPWTYQMARLSVVLVLLLLGGLGLLYYRLVVSRQRQGV